MIDTDREWSFEEAATKPSISPSYLVES